MDDAHTLPLVSVVIPTYNRYPLLLHAIDSVRQQTHTHLEIIVVDDCSTDPRYLTLAAHYRDDPRVLILRLDINQREKYRTTAAQGMTRNHGLERARGEYIALLDDDDRWIPRKIEMQLAALRLHPEFKIIGTTVFICHNSDDGTRHECIRDQTHDPEETPVRTLAQNMNRLDLFDFARANRLGNSTVLFHSSLYVEVGPQALSNPEDYEYWTRIMRHTDALVLLVPTVHYDMQSSKFYEYR